MKSLTKLNKFTVCLGGVLIGLAVLVILTLSGIFSALRTAGEISQELLTTTTPRISRDQLDRAIELIDNPEVIQLDL